MISLLTPKLSNADSPKIVIVGAGIAGLTAAYRLQNAGLNVHLFEARNRVGGRIFTATINGYVAELGGQNINDGGGAVHLNCLIDEFDLQRVYTRIPLKFIYFDGTDLIPITDQKINPEILAKRLNDLAHKHRNMKEILDELVNPQDPLYKFLAVRLAAFEGGNIEKLSPLYTETLFHILLGGISATLPANPEPVVDLMTIEGGNSLLPQRMAEVLGSHLHLNMPLTKISKTPSASYQLTFQNGTKEEADILILAIPCSVYEQITFENAIIPPERLQAIKNIQYGENAKILVPFDSVPLRKEGLISDQRICFFNPKEQLLTIYHTGATSLFSTDCIADTYAQARPIMEKSFANCPPFDPPQSAKDEANQSYVGPVGHSWPNDPFAKGSYSYIAAGQERLLRETQVIHGETFKTLFVPIDSSLYFAGEHTSIFLDAPGTMEAACESGERIARAILKHAFRALELRN